MSLRHAPSSSRAPSRSTGCPRYDLHRIRTRALLLALGAHASHRHELRHGVAGPGQIMKDVYILGAFTGALVTIGALSVLSVHEGEAVRQFIRYYGWPVVAAAILATLAEVLGSWIW